MLLIFSLFFYAYGGPPFLLLMLISITMNYLFGLLVVSANPRRCKAFMILSVVFNLGLLAWFKYAVFAAVNLNALGVLIPIPEITLPIGISFFTFQGMSYVLDVYRKDAPSQRNPLRVALYISLFPQLVAGPIVRYTTVENEIQNRKETLEEFSKGSIRFLFGLAKKMLLANALGQIADGAFGMPIPQLSTAVAWVGVIAYTGQIYFDFSAYSDMAIGLGHMFGFRFLENFNYPYIATSITDFWRRWHISLSSWFRDYVYIPLGGNRGGTCKHIRNLLIVWMLTGFWHGAAWTFLCWGLYYAVLLIGERYLWGKSLARLPAAFKHLYTMFFVVLGWGLFRSVDISYAIGLLGALFGLGQSGLGSGQAVFYLLQYRWELIIAVIAALPVKRVLENWLEAHQEHQLAQVALAWGPPVLALSLGALSVLTLVSSTFNPFIYFRF
ncbi:MAG: MBOAT family O-acyltransferase [Oscillospiraceae bacterium]